MAQIYPDIRRLFDDIQQTGTGRKLSYTPQQLVQEFKDYIEDLRATPIELETAYQKQSSNDDRNRREMQIRKQRCHRPPKLYDFVCRWLGKSESWWRNIGRGKHGKAFLTVKEKITRYCYDVKFDGAVIGIYNANIIARDLGLKDTIEADVRTKEENLTLEELNAEIERLSKIETFESE